MSHIQQALDEALTYHDLNRTGYVALLVGQESKCQTCVALPDLPAALAALDPNTNAWISQGVFRVPCRKSRYLASMGLVFSDADTYDVPELRGLSVEELLAHALAVCGKKGLPEPSTVVYSGRGLQLKWRLASPVHPQDFERWDRVQDEVCQRLQGIGADSHAKDRSRVLRVAGTMNVKSGQLARVVHFARIPVGAATQGEPGIVAYDFDALAAELLPKASAVRVEQAPDFVLTAPAGTSEPRQVTRSATPLAGEMPLVVRLAQARFDDLVALIGLRGWAGGIPAGSRDNFLFVAATLLAYLLPARCLLSEIEAFAGKFIPDWSIEQVKSSACSVLARARDAAARQRIEHGNRKVDPRYRWKTRTLVARLQILPAEQLKMKTLIGQDEGKKRDLAGHHKRNGEKRAQGAMTTRSQFMQERAKKRAQGRALRAAGKSWREVAMELGYSSAESARKSCNR